MTNAIIYCRVSTDEQADGSSLEVQERYLRAYCSNHGYNVLNVYKDDYSAKHYDLRRPEFKKMYDYCRKHKKEVDKVLFLRWDRYSRNTEFAFTYKRKFIDELGIEINAIESPIDFNGTEWSMLMGMYCGVAHTEDNKIAKRTKDGIHGILLRGKCANKAPKGYKNVRRSKHDCYVEVDEPKAKLIRQVFEEIAKGVETPNRIRKRLCKDIPQSSFWCMLHNPFYIGKVRVPAYGDEPEQLVEGQHEAIITEDVFYKVQDILDGKKPKSKKLNKAIYPELFLRGFITCPICGRALTGGRSTGGSGNKYFYYNCTHPNHINAKAEDVDDGFARYVGCLKPNETVMELYEAILNDLRKEENADLIKEIKQLEEKKTQFKNRIQRAKDLYLDGEMSKTEKDEAVEHNQKQVDMLQDKIDMLQARNGKDFKPKLQYALSLISNLEKVMRDGRAETKIKLISSMFPQKIEFDGKKFRTNSYNKVLDLIFQETKQLQGYEVKKRRNLTISPIQYPDPILTQENKVYPKEAK